MNHTFSEIVTRWPLRAFHGNQRHSHESCSISKLSCLLHGHHGQTDLFYEPYFNWYGMWHGFIFHSGTRHLHMIGNLIKKINDPLQWRHNGRDNVSNHQPRDCLLNRLFRRRSKKTSKLRVTGLCAGNSPATGEFPAQRSSNAEHISIWWRHHALTIHVTVPHMYLVLSPLCQLWPLLLTWFNFNPSMDK